MAESALEMARRHVAEGKRRIGRQLRLIDELERDRLLNLRQQAVVFLGQMREHQALAEEHLAREEARAATPDR